MVMHLAKSNGWACLTIGVALAWQPIVRADEASLSWVRLPGAEDCIGAPELAALVEQRIGRPVLQAPSRAEISIEGRVAKEGDGGWLAVIDVGDRRGGLLGRRQLRITGEPCSALDRPASLIISVLIDRDAAGPALVDGDRLSPDAQRLLAQLNLPSAKPDEVLALLVGHEETAPVPAAEADELRPGARGDDAPSSQASPAPRMISVPEAEWRRMRALAPPDSSDVDTATPAWPGYALLGLGAAATGLTVYALTRIGDLEDDPAFVRYGEAVYVADQTVTDVCAEAKSGFAYGVDESTLQRARDACGEGQTLEVLGWVFAGTALASSVLGGAWLLWIADDDDEASAGSAARRAHVALQPLAAPGLTGLRLRIRL